MRNYDIFNFGNVSIDIIKTPTEEYELTFGPIMNSVWTAHQLGYSVGVLTKTSLKDKYRLKEFPVAEEDLFWCKSSETSSTKLHYQTETMETRVFTNLSLADPYRIEEFPEFSARIIQYSGLVAGEVDLEIIRFLSGRAPIAIDVQGLIRKVLPDGAIEYVNWDDDLLEALPLITYLKADAAEAAFITGIRTEDHEGRVAATKKFLEWGAKEVVISHHRELIAAGKSFVVCSPFRNRNSSGRTGRGDTCFTTYITERFTKPPADAVKFAAALTSLKMEIPGAFKKTRQDAEAFMKEFY